MSAVSSSPRIPELDKYELLDEIGHGGMATVYRARDLRLDREVAVKVIHKHLRENPEVRRRFVSEARAVAKLRHPGIVDVYDVSAEDDDDRYLVVELIRGTTLRKILEEHEVLPAEVAAALVARLCDAVQHAHDGGVIHRDIKPENVLVELPRPRPSRAGAAEGETSEPRAPSDPPGAADSGSARSGAGSTVRVKLADFGIAKVLDVQGVTSTGQILGSPAHMAPEQIDGGEVGPATDVFALGVLMYECMVGHLPFEGKNPAQVLRKVLEGIYEQADRERPEVGGRWARLIASALHIDVELRLASAAALGGFIDEELAALGIEDPARCLDEYFADPAGFRATLCDQLVQRLLRRGERERRVGHIQGAAADFNRALALRPDDLAILRRVSSLSAQAAWRERGRRAARLLAVAIALGAGAFGLTRVLRPVLATSRVVRSSLGGLGAPRGQPSGTSARTARAPVGSVRPPLSASGAPTVPLLDTYTGRTLGTGEAPARVPRMRKVRFHLNPASALLWLDGAEVSWFGVSHVLKPGVHQVRAAMPPGSQCCDEVVTTVNVIEPPEGDADQVQPAPVSLPIHDASATLVGAPLGASVSCGNGLTAAAGATGVVKMTKVQWEGSCTFSPGGLQRGVTLRAGEANRIAWPGP